MVVDILCEEDKQLVPRVAEGLRLLEDDALGGGGSRGSGRVKFSGLSVAWRGRGYYATGAAEASLANGLDAGGLQALVNGSDFASTLTA